MALIKYNPVTPSQRELILIDNRSLWRGAPYKPLTAKKKSSGGRNNLGRITVFGKSRGSKKVYRIIDFKRNCSLPAVVERIEYDPNRSANIALIKYSDETYSYIISPNALKVGDDIISAKDAEIKPGNCLPLGSIPVNVPIHNVEMKFGKGGQIARSAGVSAQIINKADGKAFIKMQSGEVRVVDVNCRGTIGVVSNPDRKNLNLGKAGRNRWLGNRPKVRGVAKNPVDHPHGGGEGKSSGGRHPVTKFGKPTKGYKTRNNKRTDSLIIKSRHDK